MTETVAAPRTLDDPLKDAIRKAYTTLQANTPGFSTRRSQSQMIGVVSRALSKSGGVGVVEAPTGVGKSLGYLTAGVPIALASKKKLVISTGTVALQSQLVERDIPNFLKATGLEATAGDHQPRPAQPHHHAGLGLCRAPLCLFGAVRSAAFAQHGARCADRGHQPRAAAVGAVDR